MASPRTCLNALRLSQAGVAASRGALPSRRAYLRRVSNWASTSSRDAQSSRGGIGIVSQQDSNVVTASSPSWLRHRRHFSSSPASRHGHLDPPKPGEERHVTFIDKDGHSSTFVVADGDNLLDIALANDIEMEGACGGSCACSTCHVIVEDEALYDKMEEPDDDENDMLDLAFGLTETSRLGCQVKMTKDLDGLVVRLPSMTRNLQASDFK
ncbi:ferredoxin [Plenodomus tracheiphilus IPT5]|uniref:Ferredoxin n=1 Tax=Plenodomus tracheiphilus IPT5 TaxID=1408161 RepID=A0A6A7AR99_9PLEO|nr:ferredoxin [Plenodomus tracheiphilus IPT5]